MVEYSIRENNSIDNPTLKKKILDKTKINLNLSLQELSNIRKKILDKNTNSSLKELVNNIKIPE